MKPESPKRWRRHRLGLAASYPLLLLAILYVSVFLAGNSREVQQRVQAAISDALPGTLGFAELRLGPTLARVRIHGVRIDAPNDPRPAIEVDQLRAGIDPFAAATGQIRISGVELLGTRVLVDIGPKGEVNLERAFSESGGSDPRTREDDGDGGGGGPSVYILGATLHDTEVLVNLADGLTVHIPSLHIGPVDVTVAGGSPRIESMLVAASEGTVLLMPELLGLMDPRESTAFRPYRMLRRRDPWGAVRPEVLAELASSAGDGPAPLVAPLRDFAVWSFALDAEGPDFRYPAVTLLVGGERLQVHGSMRMTNDRRAGFEFQAAGSLTLAPDSPLLAPFAADVLRRPEGASEDGLVSFDVAGSLAQIAGSLGVDLPAVEVAGRSLRDLHLAVQTEAGGPFRLLPGGFTAAIGEGGVALEGQLDPSDGTFVFDAWIDRLPGAWVTATGAGEVSPIQGVLSSTPATPVVGLAPGLRLRGDLGGKHLGAFALVRLQERDPSLIADIVDVQTTDLTFTPEPAMGLPFSPIAVSGRLLLSADGRLRLMGTGSEPDLALRLGAEQASARGTIDLLTQRFDGLRVAGAVRSVATLLGVDDLDARVSAVALLDGSFAQPAIRLSRVTASNISLPGGITIGEVETTADLAVGAGLPQAHRGQLTARNIAVAGQTIAEVTAGYAFDGQRVDVRGAQIRTDFGDIALDGSVGLFEGGQALSSPRLNLHVRGGGLDLAALVPDLDVAGGLGLDVRVTGSPDRPRVEGTVSLEEAMIFNEWIDEAVAEVRYSSAGIEVESFRVSAEGGEIEGALSLGADGSLRSGRVSAHGFRLENLRALAGFPLPLTGVPQIDLEIIPPDEVTVPAGLELARPAEGYPDVQGSVIVRELSIGGVPPTVECDVIRPDGVCQGSLAFVVDTHGDSIVALGQIVGALDARIEYPFAADRPIHITGTFDNVDLPLLAPELAELFSRGELDRGSLDVQLFDGGAGDILAELSIGHIALETGGRRFETARPIHVTYAARTPEGDEPGQLLNITELSFGSEESFLEVSGDVRDWNEINIAIDGAAPLSLLTVLEDVVADATGEVGIDIDLSGTMAEPVAAGRIGFVDATVTPRGLGDVLAIAGGQIDLREPTWDDDRGGYVQALSIPDHAPIEGSLFGGWWEIRGEVELDRFTPYAMEWNLFATGMSYSIPNMALVTLGEADLTLVAPDLAAIEGGSPLRLEGEVLLQESLYFRDEGGDGGVTGTVVGIVEQEVDREVERYEAPIFERIPALGTLELDVRLRAPAITVRNNVFGADVDLTLSADLSVSGTPLAPQLNGQVTVVEGEIVFQNNTFVMQGCTAEFDGRLDPTGVPVARLSSCVAEATIERATQPTAPSNVAGTETEGFDPGAEMAEPYIVTVTVEGEFPNDYSLTFAGAGLEPGDVLTLILTGRTTDELAAGGTGSNQGVGLVVGELVELLRGRVQDFVDVDELVVIPSVAGEGTEIRLMERVSRRLTVDVGATVLSEDANQQNVRGQITLFDWLLLEIYAQGDQQNNVQGGGRIRLRLPL